MPRKPRIFIENQPQHVVVRGHNREPILARPNDFRFLYLCLKRAASINNLTIHAWVFMNNHIHLLATPPKRDSLPKTMQSLGRRYAQYFNRCYQRTGSLWEGRYKSSMVDTDKYLLCCYRYIELNPVRAGIVRKPEDYAYSSYHTNALGKHDSMVTPHSVFTDFLGGAVLKNLSDTSGSAHNNYRELCLEVLDRKTLANIRGGTAKGLGIGKAEFLLKVARLS